MRFIRRGAIIASALAVAAVSLPFGQAASAQAAPTDFYFRGSGWGTQVVGGALPVNSGKTAMSVLDCTSRAPVRRQNELAGVDLGGLVDVGAIKTFTETKAHPNGAYASVSRSRIASLTVGTDLAHLELTGIGTGARAAHNTNRFVNNRWVNIGDAELVLAGVPVLGFDLNQLFTPSGVTIPGIATIKGRLGGGNRSDSGAWVKATGLRIELLEASGSPATINIGRSWAAIGEKPPQPQVGGKAYAARARALNGAVASGVVALQPLPCDGTGGEWLENSTADVNVPGVINVGAAESRTFSRSVEVDGSMVTRGESDVANVSLLGGALEIDGVHTQGLVQKRRNGRYIRSRWGTTVASITFNGNAVPLPAIGETIEIPGVARIAFGKKQVLPRGMRLTGIEVDLLDGNVATVKLGQVNLFIR